MKDFEYIKDKIGTASESVVPILYMSTEELRLMASDESKPFYIRKMVEMLSSDNPATSMEVVKYLQGEETKIQKKEKEKEESFLDKVESFGMVRYPLDRILNIIRKEYDPELFESEFNNPQSDIAQAYQRGVDIADYEIDRSLLIAAKSGDLSALEKYERRLRIRATDDDD